jgi:hypothetical protein
MQRILAKRLNCLEKFVVHNFLIVFVGLIDIFSNHELWYWYYLESCFNLFQHTQARSYAYL